MLIPIPHRAVRRYTLSFSTIAFSIALCIAMLCLVIVLLPQLMQWWAYAIDFWVTRIGVPLQIVINTKGLIPSPKIVTPTFLPSMTQWWISCLVCATLLVLSMRAKREWLPLIYFLRLLVCVQTSALIYFYIWPQSLPTTVSIYLADLVEQAAGLMLLVPVLFGLTLYPFALAWWVKLLATLASLAFITLTAPLQIATNAWILHTGSILWLPILFLFFSLLPQIVALMCIYSLALSFSPSEHDLAKRGVLTL